MDYLSLQFLIYLGRWLLSAVVMAFPLALLIKYKCCANSKYMEYIHLVLVSITGAFIFYRLDYYLFK